MPSPLKKLVFGPEGLAAAATAAKLVVDFSSIHPDAARDIAARLKAARTAWLDRCAGFRRHKGRGGRHARDHGRWRHRRYRKGEAPCSGDGAPVHAYGPDRRGSTTKLCNQIIVGCAMAVLAEATRLAVNAGIDAGRLPEALAGGFADSIPLRLFVPRMLQEIHTLPLGHIPTMLKDLDTVGDVARKTSTPVPMASLAGQMFRLAKAARGADTDALEIYKLSADKPVHEWNRAQGPTSR